MRRTIAIGCVLFLVGAACGTAAVDGSDVDATTTSEPTGSGQTATADGDDTASASTTTAPEASAVPATDEAAPTTTRAPSAADGVDTSTTAPGGGEDGTDAEGEGDDAVTGQVPTHLMDQVFAHAEDHTGMAASSMTVLRAESVTWPDGSLGCPEPGMQYTQALVPGYWVELEVDGEVLDYRLSDKGGLKLCEGGGSVPSARDDT